MWESEKLYLDGDDFYAALLVEMEGAKRSIDMEVYAFESGVLAGRLCESFQRARLRGVLVRIIFDHWGSQEIEDGLYQRLVESGVKVSIHRGLPWSFFLSMSKAGPACSGLTWVRQFLQKIKRLNRGFHRKVTIIDGESAWVSSLNVTDVHLREIRGAAAWQDVGVRLTGNEVRVLSVAFKRAFGERVPFEARKVTPKLVLLNDTPFLRGRMNRNIRKRIQRATSRVWVQNPYFLPPRRLFRALCHAARCGRDVRILIPRNTDHWFVRWMSLAMMELLLQSGVRVLEYQGTFCHKKILIVDGETFLGSVNFNHRSFLHDLEVEVALTHDSSKAQVESAFHKDEGNSVELTLSGLRNLPVWLRIASRLLFFLRYWC